MEKTGETSAAAGEDRISALPDDVLHLEMSCLPSDDAVRTSVLARRWRHQWKSLKSARAIRVAFRRRCIWTPRTLTMFVNHLLLLRGYSPVDECDIRCGELDEDEDYYSGDEMSAFISKRTAGEELSTVTGMWIRHAVSFCKARVLKVSVRHIGNRLHIPDVPFVSDNLTILEIAEAKLTFGTLDFSRCPALEVLEFSRSRIDVGRILSPSLRRLRLDGCNFTGETRTRISTPRLVSLHVTVSSGCAPSLDDMLMLVVAHVRIEDDFSSCICKRRNNPPWDCDLKGCYECKGVGDGGSILFHGLSGATDLELTSNPHVFIFRRDCQFCIEFGNLKTLLLNEWCMTPDFSTLVYFLRYTPVLEKLTLQLEYCDGRFGLAVAVTDEEYSPQEDFFRVKTTQRRRD